MKSHATSSGDRTADVYRYLESVPDNQRVKLNGRIERTGKIPGELNGHREVKIVMNDGEIVYQCKQ